MKGIISLFSMRGKRRSKPINEEDGTLPPFPEIPPDPLSVPEPGSRTGERLSEEDASGPIRRITEFIRNLAARAEETIRGAAVPGAADLFGMTPPLGDDAPDGRDGLFSVPAFRAEVKEEDIPFLWSGFTGETSGGSQELSRESFRLLLDRTEEMKEVLSRLNETADDIRKELTI